MNANVFKEAREVAKACVLPSYSGILRARVDEAKEVFDRFHLSASKRDFEDLVAAWTRLLIALDAARPFVGGPPGTNGGRLRPQQYNVSGALTNPQALAS